MAIGSPTLEIYIESWNAKYPNDKLYTSSNSTGNYVATTSDETSDSVDMSSTTGYQDTLYYPNTSIIDDNKCYGYWLTTPSVSNTGRILRVSYDGGVTYNYYDRDLFGVRPLVCLPVGVQANKEGDIWKLV